MDSAHCNKAHKEQQQQQISSCRLQRAHSPLIHREMDGPGAGMSFSITVHT